MSEDAIERDILAERSQSTRVDYRPTANDLRGQAEARSHPAPGQLSVPPCSGDGRPWYLPPFVVSAQEVERIRLNTYGPGFYTEDGGLTFRPAGNTIPTPYQVSKHEWFQVKRLSRGRGRPSIRLVERLRTTERTFLPEPGVPLIFRGVPEPRADGAAEEAPQP